MNLFERAGMAALNLAVKLAGSGQKLPRSSQAPIHAAATQDGKAIYTDWSAEKAIREGQKANAWVFTAISKVSTGLASVPLILEKRQGDGWQAEPGHELQALLNRPNPFMARQDMLERWSQHMLLAGNALWWLNIAGGKPTELWPVPPDQISPIASRAEFIAGYEWKITSQDKRILPAAEVAHWMFIDPGNPRWGLAPIQAAAGAIDLDQAASRWNRAVLANDGKPPLAVILDSSLNINVAKEAAALVREQIDGGSIRQALVLGGTSKVQPLSLSASDLDFLNGRRFSREEIGAVFGVPGVLLHAGESATYANLEAAKLILWEDRIVPMSDDLTQGLMMALFPYWQLDPAQWRIRADLGGVRALQGNLKTEAETGKLKAEMYAALVNAGVPPNMAAAAAGLPLDDIPGGDQPRQQAPPGLPAATKAKRTRLERKDKGDPPEVAQRLARMDDWTDEIHQKVSQLLLEQGNAVAAAYVKGGDWEGELSLDDWQSLLEAIHTAVIESEGALAYAAALKVVTGSGGGVFDVLADGVTEWIDDHVGDMVKGITDTSKAALRSEIAAGVKEGESVKDIAKRIKSLHTDWADWRATTIARTEVGSAFGAAHQLAAEQIDVPMVKQWLATSDSRTRPEHSAMNGETVNLDEPFSNGAMTAPHGVNCRCVCLYRPKE